MKRSRVLIVGSLALVALLAVELQAEPPSASASSDAMLAAAKALDARFLKAFNSGTQEELAALYWDHADMTMYPPDVMEVCGGQAVRASVAAMTTADPRPQLAITNARYRVAGDCVIGWGTWKMSVAGPEGEPMEILGRYTDVKAERDGHWVYILDHVSVPMPAHDHE